MVCSVWGLELQRELRRTQVLPSLYRLLPLAAEKRPRPTSLLTLI